MSVSVMILSFHDNGRSTAAKNVASTLLIYYISCSLPSFYGYGRSTAAKNVASTLEARAHDATAAAEAVARSSAEAEAKVEEVRKALKAEAGGAGGSLAGGAQVRATLLTVWCSLTQCKL